ncbi:hypothetical protein GQ600_19798 [Phytophthora cactorum]|nr:hypothetical protein GQ600_19798 [Phytophthora cactorum]
MCEWEMWSRGACVDRLGNPGCESPRCERSEGAKKPDGSMKCHLYCHSERRVCKQNSLHRRTSVPHVKWKKASLFQIRWLGRQFQDTVEHVSVDIAQILVVPDATDEIGIDETHRIWKKTRYSRLMILLNVCVQVLPM